MNFNFENLVLMMDGTSPLHNFVVADYFLQNNNNLKTIWLIHSEKNAIQAGAYEQAKNLEKVLRERWEGKHPYLKTLRKVALSDINDVDTIREDIEDKMLSKWRQDDTFHLNYTGGFVSAYHQLAESKWNKEHAFSRLDVNNFRLVVDNYGIVADDLRKIVKIEFEDLIALHGFKQDNTNSLTKADIFGQLKHKFKDIAGGCKIRKPHRWQTYKFDAVIINGYHLTGISYALSSDKQACESEGFKIIAATRKFGGPEARSILITRLNRPDVSRLQEELACTANANILILGIEDLKREKLYLHLIEEFIFD
jgi:hypothetical protein